MQPPHIELRISQHPSRRRSFRTALKQALAGKPGGPWSVRIEAVLVYANPSVGTWWWCVSLAGAGHDQTFLVGPAQQTPEFVCEALGRAIRGDLFTIVCASCGRMRLEGGAWQRRRLKDRSRLSHGLCPECALKLYPEQMRAIAERSRGRRP